ncbi:hypothetical protein R9X44_28700 [Actinocorallia sp. A-T 12471]|nr:hypothetical protein [Actinocorallia sp. A-T 12471]MDX6743791.1 hypothetical protein [Actinocorallia sp. A-T 12471]
MVQEVAEGVARGDGCGDARDLAEDRGEAGDRVEELVEVERVVEGVREETGAARVDARPQAQPVRHGPGQRALPDRGVHEQGGDQRGDEVGRAVLGVAVGGVGVVEGRLDRQDARHRRPARRTVAELGAEELEHQRDLRLGGPRAVAGRVVGHERARQQGEAEFVGAFGELGEVGPHAADQRGEAVGGG